jgi:hypothetical protein
MPGKKKAAKSKAVRQADRQRKARSPRAIAFITCLYSGLAPLSTSFLQAEQLLSASIPSGFIGNLDEIQKSGICSRCSFNDRSVP